jgi:hypothetical protein
LDGRVEVLEEGARQWAAEPFLIAMPPLGTLGGHRPPELAISHDDDGIKFSQASGD